MPADPGAGLIARKWERLRWRIVKILNRSRRTCWSALGSWAVYGDDPRNHDFAIERCRKEAQVVGSCWCNKVNPSEGRP